MDGGIAENVRCLGKWPREGKREKRAGGKSAPVRKR